LGLGQPRLWAALFSLGFSPAGPARSGQQTEEEAWRSVAALLSKRWLRSAQAAAN